MTDSESDTEPNMEDKSFVEQRRVCQVCDYRQDVGAHNDIIACPRCSSMVWATEDI